MDEAEMDMNNLVLMEDGMKLYLSVSDDDEEADVTEEHKHDVVMSEIRIEATDDDVPCRKPEPMSNPTSAIVHVQVCPVVEEEEYEGHGGPGGHVKAGEDDEEDLTPRAQLQGQAQGVHQESHLVDDDVHQPLTKPRSPNIEVKTDELVALLRPPTSKQKPLKAKRRLVDKKEDGTMEKGIVQSKIVAFVRLTNTEGARPVKTPEGDNLNSHFHQNNPKRKASDFYPEQGPGLRRLITKNKRLCEGPWDQVNSDV